MKHALSLCRQLGMQVLMFYRMRRWRKEILALVDMWFHMFDALCKKFGACLVGDNGPPPAVRVHNNQILSQHQR